MEKMEQEIIGGALRMFNRYGIRSVTMDDVARELSVSKKTIYKYFENKADLVHKCVRTIYEHVYQSLMEIQEQSENAIDELFEIDEVVGRIMESHNPGLRFQLQKYYPQTFNALYEERHKLIHKVISENIKKGKKKGLYRADADTEVVSFLYCSKVESIPEEDQEMLQSHTIKFVARQALEYHIRGLATEKGIEYLNQKLKNHPHE